MSEATLTTYSMWNSFRNCRKACEWRYVRELVPVRKEHTLTFGSLIHECLEMWHRGRDINGVLELIDGSFPDRFGDDSRKSDWHLARAMMAGYARTYKAEDFDVVSLEKRFDGRIINPATGAASRSLAFAGKIDGLVSIDGKLFILEHKTASQVDGDYLEKLWTDLQITLYAMYIEQTLGVPISGILYNVLVKARIQQGRGETQGEYDARRAELIAKSKTGKTSATRKMPETDEEFAARLAAKYAEPGMFHREMLYISRDSFETVRAELWELSRQFLDCRRRGVFYRNTSYCFAYHRPCAYFPLCRSNGSENVIANFYEHRAPHEELREEEPHDEPLSF